MEEVGKLIRRFRLQKGLTQDELVIIWKERNIY